MKKKSISREDAEMKEGFEQVSNDVPENRQQAKQQVAMTSDAEQVEAPKSKFSASKSKAKGDTLKQQIISDVITGSSPNAGMGINFAGRSRSGATAGILGANNSTPEAGQSRSGSRVGKKLDRIATKLNYTPCEQCIIEVDESKPLADAADVDQGYNGTYRNATARSQKIAGAVPADLLYQRSVDLITKDKLYFVEGQQVFQDGLSDEANEMARLELNPTETVDPEKFTEDGDPVYRDTKYHSGNYLHTGMHVGLNADGSAHYAYFDVEDVTPKALCAEETNMASAHRLIKSNVAEVDRMIMDAKAGDEKAEKWSCLPRAIHQPTKASYLMSSIEADTGAFVHLAYSKATTNMAYQLNRAAKDGLTEKQPAIEQCMGWRSTANNSLAFNDIATSLADVFTAENYRAGDPSLMIAAYDSTGKYNSKADLVLQPRGWRMHLQTADNNMNPLKVPKEYANVYASNEVFSTIDHDYDPVLPVCMTDKANLITVHNFNELSGFVNTGVALKSSGAWSELHSSQSTFKAHVHDVATKGEVSALKALGYNYIQGFYKVKTGSGFENEAPGIDDDDNGAILISYADSSSSGKRECEYIFAFTATNDAIEAPDGYSAFTVMALTKDQPVRVIIPAVQDTGSSPNKTICTVSDFSGFAEQLLYQVESFPYVYAYSDLRNIYTVEVKHPLVQGILDYLKESVGGKIRSLIGRQDFYIPFVFSTQYMTLAQLLICAATPWITRVRLNSMRDVLYLEDEVGFYPFQKLSSLKDVPFKNYVNFVFHDYDSPLETKIMDPVRATNWIMPEFFWKVATEKYVAPWYTNEEDLNANGTVNEDAATMSMPSIRSGYKLGGLDTLYGMTEKDIRLSLDRITKSFFNNATKFAGFGAYKYGRTTDGQIFCRLNASEVISVRDLLSAPRELGLTMDCPLGVLTKDPADQGEANIINGAYKAFDADGTATSYRIRVWVNSNTFIEPSILAEAELNIGRAANYVQKWFELTANNATTNTAIAGLVFGLNDEGAATFKPFAVLGSGAQDGTHGVNIVSHQRSINTRLQFLPFIISPFDAVTTADGSINDIYDFAYYFNLCGFRASDYRESVYNREKEVINQGMLFLEDPWILASPIIQEGIRSTGVNITKGYTVK